MNQQENDETWVYVLEKKIEDALYETGSDRDVFRGCTLIRPGLIEAEFLITLFDKWHPEFFNTEKQKFFVSKTFLKTKEISSMPMYLIDERIKILIEKVANQLEVTRAEAGIKEVEKS